MTSTVKQPWRRCPLGRVTLGFCWVIVIDLQTGVTYVRMKSEDRRQAIINVAIKAFREVGFERTTMGLISNRLGGSKGTIYSYFSSKEELFEAAMKAASEGPGDRIMGLLDCKSGELKSILVEFAIAYLNFVLDKDVLAIKRTAIADGYGSTLGPHLFAHGPRRAISKFTVFVEKEMARGRLRTASSLTAALHFKGLIETGFIEEALYGAKPALQRRVAVRRAVDVFLRAYGPQQQPELH
jgi:AcrR family transcriptional regulator